METNSNAIALSKIEDMTPLLMVFDMPDSLKFYCETLGFELVESAGPPGDMGWAMMRLGDIWLMLNTLYELHERPASPDPSRIIAHGDTTLYFGSPDIEAIYEHIKSQGITVSEPYFTGYGFKAIDLKDPDGYTIVFHSKIDESNTSPEDGGNGQ